MAGITLLEDALEDAALLPKGGFAGASDVGAAFLTCKPRRRGQLLASAVAAALMVGFLFVLFESSLDAGHEDRASLGDLTEFDELATPGAVPPDPAHLMREQLVNRPKSDERQYQYSLLSNGLRVLNIQDNHTTRFAAAVAVQAGSFNDPVSLPGLAHFCEHMLFLGTREYPDANGFDNFMVNAGGENNAYTANEVTVYYASLAEASRDELMARFSDFFRAPLFQDKYVEKEVHAINSEHLKNVQSPERRILEVMNAIAVSGSPVSRFHTGNMETLYSGPQRRHQNPVDALQEYFSNNYCPGRMRLVTAGSASLDEQLHLSELTFGNIPMGNDECRKPRVTFENPPPFPPSRMGKWLVIQGSEPQPSLWLHWQLRDLTKDYPGQPLDYLNHVLFYQGVDSLVRTLEDSFGLATGMNWMSDMSTAGTSLYLVIALTQMGRERVDLVLDTLYAYFGRLLREGINPDLYKSLQDVDKLEWDWAAPGGVTSTVSNFAERMTRLPPDDLLTGDGLITKLEPKLVEYVLSCMTPSNMNAALVDQHPKFGSEQVRQLPYYGVNYTVGDLSAKMPGAQLKWTSWLTNHRAALEVDGLKSALKRDHIKPMSTEFPKPPGPIEGIPTDLDLVHMRVDQGKAAAVSAETVAGVFGPRPQLIEIGKPAPPANTAKPMVWYRSGWVTKSPEANVITLFHLIRAPDEPYFSAVDSMRLNLYASLFAEELVPLMADLVLAGGSYSLGVDEAGLSISVSGFEPIVPRLATTLLKQFNRFNTNLNLTRPERFHRIVEEEREALSSYTSMPISYALEDRNILLNPGSYSREESLRALSGITAESAARSVGELFLARPLKLSALAMGNVAAEQATDILNTVATGIQLPRWLTPKPVTGEVQYVRPVVKPPQPIEIRAINPREQDPNDAAVVTLVYGVVTVEAQVLLDILGRILSSVIWQELRTKRQLGYVASAGYGRMSNVGYVSALVQGAQLDADGMEAAIEMVLAKAMPEKLRSMTDEEFLSFKDAFAKGLLERPTSAEEEMAHFWNPVKLGGDCFSFLDSVLRYSNTSLVSRESLQTAWAELASPVSGVRTKISIKYFADRDKDGRPRPLPDRPSDEAAARLFQQAEVPAEAQQLLLRERTAARLFGRTTAADRRELEKQSGYYPADLHCRLQPGTESAIEAAASASGGLSDEGEQPPPLLAALGKRAGEMAGAMGPKDIASTLDAYSRLGNTPEPEVFDRLAQRTEDVAPLMAADDLATTLNAFAKLHQQPSDRAWDAMSDRLVQVVDGFNARNITSVINAYAVLNHLPPDTLLAKLAPRLEKVAVDMDAEDVALNLIWFAKLWTMHRNTLMASVRNSSDMHSDSGANVLGAYATVWKMSQLRALGASLLKALATQAAKVAADMNAGEVASTLDSFAIVGEVPDDWLFTTLGHRAETVGKDMTAHDVARTLNAFARLRRPPGFATQAVLVARCADVVSDMGARQVADVLNAFAWLGNAPDSELMMALGKRAEEVANNMTASDVASVLHAFATLDVTPARGLTSLLEARLPAVADDLDAQDVARIYQAFVTMGRRLVDPAKAALEHRAREVGPSMNVENLTCVLVAYTRLELRPDESMLAVLVRRAEELAPEMDADHVSKVVNAYAKVWEKVSSSIVGDLSNGTPSPANGALALRLQMLENLGHRLLAAVGKRVVEVAAGMTSESVANTMEAYAQLREKPSDEVLTALVLRLKQVVNDMSASDVARTIDAYTKLQAMAAAAPHQGVAEPMSNLG